MAELESLRGQIDAADAELIALLGRRFGYTDCIGVLKQQNQLPSVDANREARQQERHAVLAGQAGVSAQLVERVFRLIIDEVVCKHESLRTGAPETDLRGRRE